MSSTNNYHGGTTGRTFFSGADALTDNHALVEWAENTRRILHAAALELGITASELEARLRRVGGGNVVVGGMSARLRARQVTRPLQQASESLVIASQYVITANNRFLAAFLPELEQAGYRNTKPDFNFKA